MFLLETTSLKAINTGLKDTLRSGSYISFTVNKKLDTNLYQILLLGKYINVKSNKNLKQGSVIKAQIIWNKNTLQLKVVEKKSLPSNLQINEIDLSKIKKQIIVEEIINSNMPLNTSYFKILEPVIRKNKKTDHKLVKILLLLIDKGIPVNNRNIKEISNFSNNINGGNHGNTKKDQRSIDKSIDGIKEDIKKQIKNTDTGNDLIKFFNHSIAKHDNWIIIPFNFTFSRLVQGVLKIKLNKSFVITNLVLTLDDGNNWEFSLVKNKKGGDIKVSGPNGLSWLKSKSFTKLKEKLYNMGIIFDDINKEWTLIDGFTDTGSGKLKNIDFIV